MKAKPTACYFILQGNSGSSVFDFSATDSAMFLLFDSSLCCSSTKLKQTGLEHTRRLIRLEAQTIASLQFLWAKRHQTESVDISVILQVLCCFSSTPRFWRNSFKREPMSWIMMAPQVMMCRPRAEDFVVVFFVLEDGPFFFWWFVVWSFKNESMYSDLTILGGQTTGSMNLTIRVYKWYNCRFLYSKYDVLPGQSQAGFISAWTPKKVRHSRNRVCAEFSTHLRRDAFSSPYDCWQTLRKHQTGSRRCGKQCLQGLNNSGLIGETHTLAKPLIHGPQDDLSSWVLSPIVLQ